MRALATGFRVGLLLVSVTSVGCDDGGAPMAAAAGCVLVSEEGGSLVSSDGVLTISIRPQSLDDTIELCIEAADGPKGPPAVFSPAYRVRPDIDLDIDASITFTHPIPDQEANAAVGAILYEEFAAGEGRWLPLPTKRFEPDTGVIAASDGRLSMFYGILERAGGE